MHGAGRLDDGSGRPDALRTIEGDVGMRRVTFPAVALSSFRGAGMRPIGAGAKGRISIPTNPFGSFDPYPGHGVGGGRRSVRHPCGGAVLIG